MLISAGPADAPGAHQAGNEGTVPVGKKARSRLIAEIPHLRRYARVLTRDAEAADELVQNCLERALSRLHLWQQHRRLRPWLFTIMHNLHVNTVRYAASRPRAVPLEDVARLPRVEAEQDNRLEVRAVLAALDQLPEDQRAALLLVALEGLSYKEAASVLGVPTGTLMSRLHRGRERLREALSMTERRTALRQIK